MDRAAFGQNVEPFSPAYYQSFHKAMIEDLTGPDVMGPLRFLTRLVGIKRAREIVVDQDLRREGHT